jgi:hypothetical protein
MQERRATTEPRVSEPLTWQEICALHPEEWVALVEIDWLGDSDLEFRTARVVGHGKTRSEPLAQARPVRARYDEVGHFFTGAIHVPRRSFIMPSVAPPRLTR